MNRFRLNTGKHQQKEDKTGKSRLYRQGEIIETEADLSKLNTGGGTPKFERLEDRSERRRYEEPTPATTTPTVVPPSPASSPSLPQGTPSKATQSEAGYTESELAGMTVNELKELAAEDEIDVKGAQTKAELIKVLAKKK